MLLLWEWQHCTNFQMPIFAQFALTYAKFNTSWYKNTELPSCSPDKYNNLNHSTCSIFGQTSNEDSLAAGWSLSSGRGRRVWSGWKKREALEVD